VIFKGERGEPAGIVAEASFDEKGCSCGRDRRRKKIKRRKTMLKKIIVTLAASVLLLAALPLHARHTLSNILQVTVPFEFLAGDRVLPSGNYTVEVNSERGIIVLRGADGQQPLVLLTNPVETLAAKKHSHLLFRRYDTAFFLVEVWRSDDSVGRTLPTTDLQKEMARKRTLDQKILVEARER
jgi:hypothetical protein